MPRTHRKINKRISGDYIQKLATAFQELFTYRDDLSRTNFKVALQKYFHLPISPGNYFPVPYQYLHKQYGRGDGILDFGFFRLPEPNMANRLIFMYEFIDLLAPFLFPGRVSPASGVEGNYEQFGVDIEAGDIVIDAGANIGMFSAYAAAKGAHVFAFEPMPEPLKYLYKTRDINKALSGSITIVPLALTAEAGETKFVIPENNMGAASSIINQKGTTVLAKTVTLDEWVEENGLSNVDFIKADIEGSERDLLRGAQRVLKKFKPKLAICTYHQKDDPQILENIIRSANISYEIQHTSHKLFAYYYSGD